MASGAERFRRGCPLMNRRITSSSIHRPMPVSGSGVMFGVISAE